MSSLQSREEEIFAGALAQPPEKRGAFLGAACGSDAALLARIAALIAAHEGTDSLRSSHLRQGYGGQTESLREEPVRELTHEERAGDTIDLSSEAEIRDTVGRYKLLQKIGEGGPVLRSRN